MLTAGPTAAPRMSQSLERAPDLRRTPAALAQTCLVNLNARARHNRRVIELCGGRPIGQGERAGCRSSCALEIRVDASQASQRSSVSSSASVLPSGGCMSTPDAQTGSRDVHLIEKHWPRASRYVALPHARLHACTFITTVGNTRPSIWARAEVLDVRMAAARRPEDAHPEEKKSPLGTSAIGIALDKAGLCWLLVDTDMTTCEEAHSCKHFDYGCRDQARTEQRRENETQILRRRRKPPGTCVRSLAGSLPPRGKRTEHAAPCVYARARGVAKRGSPWAKIGIVGEDGVSRGIHQTLARLVWAFRD
ncbi:predicted protein [Postia placenta Mad-698-R]|uniref:Uncharacterized protein n=1 Tax=Postia placenta MAD-698-R-SB12 TaxID=670580 RepID=A0A1X6N4X4_9APHY|nr:hypothetical protein POSPLADRAFT_1045885 [Postia placenta MAD-698-R-SB12]EED84920.1 predicted protein [Postia placenta Mad-698-R]OSX63570.1 hypothetical protein POSPLADRAFT_1045885 [Postia placenta MAD-698-R-SB12]